MIDPNLDLYIEKITPSGQTSLEINYPGVQIAEDILDDSGNVLFAAGSNIGETTVDPESDIRNAVSVSIKYQSIPIIVTSAATYTIPDTQNLIVISSGTNVVLPPAKAGIRITIKTVSGPLNIIGGTIDGVAGATLAAIYDFMEIVSDGTVWFKVASS